ncbi:hypothetical protein E2C01_039064 [Portunus trituberculatus]|uniref:Uncharacterized protein n=1 Tax=Portunus trituberculatus TaxID=210409 RepID=A0A5B7FIV2_PORTR|nr:hypothetical protein [Portunus trituberculatus]
MITLPQDPVPIERWEEVRDGTKIPPSCPQIPFVSLVMRKREFEEQTIFSSRQATSRYGVLPRWRLLRRRDQ